LKSKSYETKAIHRILAASAETIGAFNTAYWPGLQREVVKLD
jgi:hypothetical protein